MHTLYYDHIQPHYSLLSLLLSPPQLIPTYIPVSMSVHNLLSLIRIACAHFPMYWQQE